ncbi:MAG: glycosyltransferase, partial [Chloroflexi bacterium]|nr:glycosyltransferase [Chloroflexota bacterium]
MNIAFLGSGTYSRPLDSTSEKKFRALKQLGNVYVIGYGTGVRSLVFTEQARFILMPKLKLPLMKYVSTYVMATPLLLWCIFRHRVRVVVAQGPYHGSAAAVAKIIARLLGRKTALVVENHGDFEVYLFVQRRIRLPAVYKWFMRAAAKFSFRHADSLRSVSAATQQQLESWAPGKPISQFPAWTDLDVFLDSGARPSVNREEATIVYAGVLIPRKGVHYLIEAFARVVQDMPNIRLLLIGKPVNQEYSSELHQRVETLGIADRVSFLGEMPQESLSRHISSSRVFVLPSVAEG